MSVYWGEKVSMGQVWNSEAGWIRAEQELQRSCYSPTVPSDRTQEELWGQCWPWTKKVYINQANYAFISQDRLSMMGSVLLISSLGQNDKTMVLSKYKCYTKRSNSLLSSNLTLSLRDPCEVTFQMYALEGTSYLTSTCFYQQQYL